MDLNLKRMVVPQLNNIFVDYKFNKNFSENLSLSIKSFFIRKLKEDINFFGSFCFNITLESEDLNSIISIKKEFILKYKDELLETFNPLSFELISFSKTLSFDESCMLLVFERIIETDEYKKIGFIQHRLFTLKELKKYVHLYVSGLKSDLLKKEFFNKLQSVNRNISEQEILLNRMPIIINKIFGVEQTDYQSRLNFFNKIFNLNISSFEDVILISENINRFSNEMSNMIVVSLSVSLHGKTYYKEFNCNDNDNFGKLCELNSYLRRSIEDFLKAESSLKKLLKIQ